jgi:hypothetical protein
MFVYYRVNWKLLGLCLIFSNLAAAGPILVANLIDFQLIITTHFILLLVDGVLFLLK